MQKLSAFTEDLVSMVCVRKLAVTSPVSSSSAPSSAAAKRLSLAILAKEGVWEQR